MKKCLNSTFKLISIGILLFFLAVSFSACANKVNKAEFLDAESNFWGDVSKIDKNSNGIFFSSIENVPETDKLRIEFYRGYNNVTSTEIYDVDYDMLQVSDFVEYTFKVPDFNGTFTIKLDKSSDSDVNKIIVFLNETEIQTLYEE